MYFKPAILLFHKLFGRFDGPTVSFLLNKQSIYQETGKMSGIPKQTIGNRSFKTYFETR